MLKVGDKVKMTPRGFKFYSNLDIQFFMVSIGGKVDEKHFTEAICEQFAIHGVGIVKKFNDEGSPYVRWENSLDGIKYYYTHYYDKRDVAKLTLLDKIKTFLKGFL